MFKVKSYSIRIDENLLKKFQFIAEYDGRSVNKQFLQLVREAVRNYEEKHGEIEIEN